MMRSTLTLRERFDRHVTRTDACWDWTASTNNVGYGVVRVAGKARLAHRVAYELVHGTLSTEGMVVRHRCDRPICVNPAHLELGTMKDNTADMMARGRNGHGCVRGSAHRGSKLNETDVALIKLLLDCGVRNVRLARLYGVSDTKVAHIKKGKSWQHVAPLEASC